MPPTGFLSDYLLLGFIAIVVTVFAVVALRRVRARDRTWRTLVAGNLLVLVTLLTWTALAAETWFRYGQDATDSYGLTLSNWRWFRRHWDLNSFEMRDREPPATKAAGVTRIAFLGDSFTAGYGVTDPDDRFPDLVRSALEQRSPGTTEVWNAGGIGWSTRDEIDWLVRQQPTARFDRVVIGYCLNDVDDLLPEDERFDRLTVERPRWWNPWQSFLADTLWFRLHLSQDRRVSGYFDWVERAYSDPTIWGEQASRLREIASVCRREEIEFDVVVFPFLNTWGADYPFDAAHDRLTELLDEISVRTLDLRSVYAGRDGAELAVSRYDAHPNELAHALAADEVLTRLFAE